MFGGSRRNSPVALATNFHFVRRLRTVCRHSNTRVQGYSAKVFTRRDGLIHAWRQTTGKLIQQGASAINPLGKCDPIMRDTALHLIPLALSYWFHMANTGPGQLARKRSNLARLRDLLTEQESALLRSWQRSENWQGASESQMAVMRELFEEAHDALPEKNIRFTDNNGFDGLQAQIISVRWKINEALGHIESSLGLPASVAPLPQDIPTPQNLPDPRSIFVVYGRNGAVRRSMFDFLRAIGLKPIEWDEAIAMTGKGAPYTGYAIDTAFSNAQAALILITGDDLACLKPEFILDDDEDSERKPISQARPNVIFEMGLAFGKKPDRTVIVEFGRTRLISDTLGRNVIRFSDTPEFRQRLAGRLLTAGCAVDKDTKSDWLSSKFDFAVGTKQSTSDNPFARISSRADVTSDSPKPTTEKEPNPLLSSGENEFIAKSPDNFLVRIKRHEDKQVKGLILGIENRRLEMIGPYRLRILNARSYDSDHQQYRDNAGFSAFVASTTKPTGPSCTGENTWLVRKASGSPHLQAGNQSPGHEMEWPNADHSYLHRWLLKIDVATQTVPKPGEQAVPLRPVELELHLVWNPEKNEFFLGDVALAST